MGYLINFMMGVLLFLYGIWQGVGLKGEVGLPSGANIMIAGIGFMILGIGVKLLFEKKK